MLTSFTPKAKRSKGVSFQRRPRPAKISRARVRKTIRGPRGKKKEGLITNPQESWIFGNIKRNHAQRK